MHLTPDDLVDLAEGARPESSAPHLASCAACRAQVNEMRALMSEVAAVDVPEPSPLFWDHLSQRVHDAAEDAEIARLGGSRSFALRARALLTAIAGRRAFQASILAVAALIIAVLVTSRMQAPDAPRPPAVADAGSREVWIDGVTPDADADLSLTLVASITASMDLDSASEAGLARDDTAEHAVTHMTDGELRELQRLLKEEMARPGA